MRRNIQISLLAAMSIMLTVLLGGCGSSNKEGEAATNVARVSDEATCRVCHADTIDPVSKRPIVPDYLASAHFDHEAVAGCEGCHGGGAEHNGVGPIPFPNPLASNRCIVCHTDGTVQVPTFVAADFVGTCAPCHTTSGIGGIHAAQVTSTVSCVKCHDISAPQHGPSLVGDNNGVRAIVPEFRKNSHHIVNAGGADPTDAQCIACHLEGKVVNGIAVVDDTYHMADAMIHLRNGNPTLVGNQSAASGVQYVWNPANPNHTAMDQFCMSCHNSAGATAVAALNLAGQTATNPFGDLISNGYDQMSRSVVVPVFDQFDTGNSTHHAVRGKKYSGRTRATANTAAFTRYSGAAVNPLSSGTDTNGNAGIGPKSPGSRYTIYEAGFFVSNYTPLGATATVADDSTLHCGDCHTVGQWKPGSTTAVTSNTDGTTNVVTGLAAIGAHGSTNEYMLRTSDGVDALHHQAENVVQETGPAHGQGFVPPTDGTYVCFLCHSQRVYGHEEYLPFAANPTATYAIGRMGGHGGLHPCEDLSFGESVGKVGSARVVLNNDGEYGGGNLFGYTCADCHNSGNKGFGGIHGGNAAWGTYSTNGGYASASNTGYNVTYRKSYRLMGGLSMRYNGGATVAKWESQVLQKSNREGCYNFAVNNKSSGGVAQPLAATNTQWVADSGPNVSPNNTEFTDGANATQTFGTWGACGHHNGTTTTGANAVPLRKVQRPLSY